MHIAYLSHAGNETGLGRAANDFIFALRLIQGVEVTERPFNEGVVLPTTFDGDVIVYHGMPSQLAIIAPHVAAAKLAPRSKARHVAMTVWETSLLPSVYAKALRVFDAVIVPSLFCKEIFEAATSTHGTPVFRVPHCFDASSWPANERPQGDQFTFYTVGGWGERKNVLGVLRAYLYEFTKADKTRLVVISNGAKFDVIKSVIARSALEVDELPGLFIPDGALSAEEIVRLHQDSDCFVSATRGEGWGLGMFEAMIMQRPVIAPSYGGQREFLPRRSGVPYQMTPVFAGEGEYDAATCQARLKLPRGANAKQLWAEPDLFALANRMRDTWELFHKDRDYSDLEEVRMGLEDRYCAPVVGQTLYRVLKELS